MLNKCNPTPYTINSDPNTPPVNTSTLCYMDDTNLISGSIDGLLHMLNVAQGFYDMNNTKINFNKAIFICNRDPDLPANDLPSVPKEFTYEVTPTPFKLTPILSKESFRFLGVWFTLSLSARYVKNQCSTEYRLFAKSLQKKKLTVDHLTYLQNMVLLPKVDF